MAKNVNNLARKMGMTLCEAGRKMIRSAFDLKIKVMTGLECKAVIEKYFPKAEIILMDKKYKTIPWTDWKSIIDMDTIKLEKYRKEYMDCDDFSYMFKYYNIRTFQTPCSMVYGNGYDLNGKWLFRHFWIAMITSDKELYFYEPINGQFVKYEGGNIILNNRIYYPITFEL